MSSGIIPPLLPPIGQAEIRLSMGLALLCLHRYDEAVAAFRAGFRGMTDQEASSHLGQAFHALQTLCLLRRYQEAQDFAHRMLGWCRVCGPEGASVMLPVAIGVFWILFQLAMARGEYDQAHEMATKGFHLMIDFPKEYYEKYPKMVDPVRSVGRRCLSGIAIAREVGWRAILWLRRIPLCRAREEGGGRMVLGTEGRRGGRGQWDGAPPVKTR